MATNMTILFLFLQAFALATLSPVEDRALPPLHDGIVVTGPGRFQQLSELKIQGKVTLKHLTLDLKAPTVLSEGATLQLEDVRLNVSDPPGAPNGTSGLRCIGRANIIVRDSTMTPTGSAHPMWLIKGQVEVDNFQATNSEFHLDHAKATLHNFKIFELEISHESQVSANHLELVFLSTHSSDTDHLQFENVPAEKSFDRDLSLGSGAKAVLKDARIQIFLLYVHGAAEARLASMERVQLAIFPSCRGTLELRAGRMGTGAHPAVLPDGRSSDCPFRISLRDVNVDTWDVYAGGLAELTLRNSRIDELNANGDAKISVEDSEVYADWMSVGDNAQMTVKRSTVGALRLAGSRPDLATSQIRLGGRSHTTFRQVRFDCGIVAKDEARVEIEQPSVPPKYVQKSANTVVHADVSLPGSNP
jgi:hypothetical protein